MSRAGLASMTGYGSSAGTLKGWRVRVDCRGVNHRGLDVRVFTPPELRWLEEKVVAIAGKALHRGRVDLRVELSPGIDEGENSFEIIDEARFEAVADQLKRLAGLNGLAAPISLESVLAYRSYFERPTEELFGPDKAAEVLDLAKEALDKFVESRRSEGEGIKKDLLGHLARLEAILEEVETLRHEDREVLRSRVEERLRQTLAEFDVGDVEESKVAQELAFFIERGDIAEELQRGKSHVGRLQKVIESASGEAVGKKIDFYLQELIRETNTMGSKSQHAGLTDLVIEMKSLIEKMREQAANVE